MSYPFLVTGLVYVLAHQPLFCGSVCDNVCDSEAGCYENRFLRNTSSTRGKYQQCTQYKTGLRDSKPRRPEIGICSLGLFRNLVMGIRQQRQFKNF